MNDFLDLILLHEYNETLPQHISADEHNYCLAPLIFPLGKPRDTNKIIYYKSKHKKSWM